MELVRPYIIFYIIIFGIYLLSLAFPKLRKGKRDWYFIAASTLVFLLIGTRADTVGTDTEDYVSSFQHLDSYYAQDDVLFRVIVYVLRLFGSSAEYYIFIVSLLGLFGLFYIIDKYSENKTMSVALFTILGPMELFFFLYFSMIRQTIALSFFFISLCILFDNSQKNKKKLWLFLLFYLFSCLTHKSALFAAPFIAIIYFKKFDKRVFWIALIMFTYVLAGLGLSITQTVLSKVFEVLGGDSHYAAYADITIGAIESRGFMHLGILPFTIIGLIVSWFTDNKTRENWIVQFFLWSVVMNNIFFDNLNYNRLTLYLTMFSIIAIPNALKNVKMIVKLPTLVFVFGYFIYKMIGQFAFQLSPFASGNIIVPYESWLLKF